MAEQKQEFKFPTEVIDLPSKGKVYPKDSPLSSGKIEVKYMTAKEEDILTSQNLIKKGVVITELLNSLIVSKDVSSDDLILGDKNALMVASRILAYGPEYTAEVINPKTGNVFEHTFDLTECNFKNISDDINNNEFEIELPISKQKITFKLLTGRDETSINNELESYKKIGTQVSPELTTRLKHTVTSVNGDDSKATISNFVDNMLSRDSLFLREELNRVAPDIDLTQEIDIEGETVKVGIPMTVNFFWPDTES